MLCITRARAVSQKGFLVATAGHFRYMTITELAKLQGGSVKHMDMSNVSRTALGSMVGNAMSGNILDKVIPRTLWAAGLLRCEITGDANDQ